MSSKRCENRMYNVAVVGLSGTEKEKGACGIGKSCLINRFMRPMADEYYTDHISVLSQSDFAGRVVNNDHFLYWGDTTKTDDGFDFRFHVVEQTEFIDDSSFQSFRIGKTEPYYKRCAMCKLQSAEKLAYICKNQLGLEHEFEQKMLPDGRIAIDGFLCLFDVSQVAHRPIERQVDYTACILLHLIKTKKPIVLVTTKNDEAYRPFVSEAERLVNRKELKERGAIPIVETSSHDNVNVEFAFLTLAYMIERSNKNRPKLVAYSDAARACREVMDVAREAYLCLVRSHVGDYKASWTAIAKKLQNDSDFVHFVELFGTDQAVKLFRKHVSTLKEEFVRQKQLMYLHRLELTLRDVLPDLGTISDRGWYSVVAWLRQQDFFDKYFVVMPDDIPWKDGDFLESGEERVPFDLLEVPEAETIFRNYVNLLRAEHRKSELKKQFRQLLEDNNNICPGKSLNEVAIFFLGRECFTSLSEKDKQEIYEEHQRALKDRAKRDFQELLLENAEIFMRFEHVMVTNDDITEVNQRLQQEPRYQALSRMEDDRRAILLNHLGFIQHSYRDRCCFRDRCAEMLIEQVLSSRASRPQSWNRNSQLLLDAQDNSLHFVILGSGQLADQLAREIRMQCVEDEYMLDGELFTLNYRTIGGDLSLPSNSFKAPNFLPHGCFCVYNSMPSLDYVRFSLDRSVSNNDRSGGDRLSISCLPIVLVLGHNPDATDRDLVLLREEGQALADRLQCPFVDVPSSMMVHSNQCFHEDQIGLAMHNLVVCIKRQRSTSSLTNLWPHYAESIEPDLRILICFMCGDGFSIEVPLAPLLNHQFCYVASDEYMSITLETFLDEAKRKVEVTATSYHGATQLRQYLYHGYVAVYSVRRKASLANLKAFASKISSVPVKILAVTEAGATAFFANESMQSLLMEGNAFADSIKASFMTTCANFQQQIASYAPFFKKCWDKKTETEIAFTFAKDIGATGGLLKVPNRSLHERMKTRPPAVLPKSLAPYTLAKSSTSNSADESDPAVLEQTGTLPASDSDPNPLDSSASLQVHDDGSIYEEVYSEIGQDTERLIKPNLAKTKRNGYADRYRKSFPGASSSFTSGYFCDVSTDTDGSVHSPKFHPPQTAPVGGATASPSFPLDLREPHYQFRKSNSMKLALKEDEEEYSATEILSDESAVSNRKLTSTFNPKLLQPHRPKPLDAKKFGPVQQVIRHNMAYNLAMTGQPVLPSMSLVKAPLATPEPIEFGDYAQVKESPLDAVFPSDHLPRLENNYASVADALPLGRLHRIRSANNRLKQEVRGSESDSECSSQELEGQKDPWVNRKPTPYKKKQHKPRRSDAFSVPMSPGDDHQSLLHSDQLDKVRDYSASDGSEGTNEEQASATHKQKKKRSLRSKKKSATLDHDLQLSWTDSDVVGQQRKISLDEEAAGRDIAVFSKVFGGEDNGDGMNWRRKLRLRSEKDADTVRQRKEEKKLKEEERRRSKQADKQKGKEKTQRKSKSKPPGSTSSMGATLEELARTEESLIPLFVQKCINYIETEGLTIEGLYRVPGNRAHVDVFLEKFREDPNTDIWAMDVPVSVVATALKSFFSDLSEPVIPLNFYDELKDALNLPDRTLRLLTVRGVLKKLPPANFAVLKFIITHINRVSRHSSENAMDSKNLSICWWPTLMRPEITSLDTMFLTTKPLEEVLQLLVEQFGFFFYGEEETTS